ncbi:hypothetical protein UFOVP661_30 [uncultured Caudovirales phage]|uniref:Uncharacterized protein n=1 Tax=uncultured Caudovirales phage TaxID=2100421 RepID=A0A6J5N8S3_9CAUD|nr:hypothetical protein UFOVP661_30 [uncultured Caudovirales phage]
MMMQLDPPIPVVTPEGKGLAQVLIDYGPEHDLMWVVFLNNGECWTYNNKLIRANINVTYGRGSLP